MSSLSAAARITLRSDVERWRDSQTRADLARAVVLASMRDAYRLGVPIDDLSLMTGITGDELRSVTH